MYSADYRKMAREALRGKWILSVVVTLVAGFLGANLGIGSNSLLTVSTSSATSSLSSAYSEFLNMPRLAQALQPVLASTLALGSVFLLIVLILGGAVNLGLTLYNIYLVQNVASNGFNTLFSRFKIFGKAFLLQLVTAFFVFLWSLLFFFPGIIAAYRYSMAPYIMAQNPDIGVFQAIRNSKEMMRGHKWRLFVLQLSFIGWVFLSMLSFGIGFLWLNPYRCAANAAFYLNVSGQMQTSHPSFVNPAAPAPMP